MRWWGAPEFGGGGGGSVAELQLTLKLFILKSTRWIKKVLQSF